jgi:hypothetical protein
MTIDIEQRLRGAWDASEALVTDLDDAAPESAIATRHRDWRAPLLAAAVVLAIAIAAAFGFSRGSTSQPPAASQLPAASQTSTGPEATPAAVLAAAQRVIRHTTVHRLDQPVEWVLTTNDQLAKLEYGEMASNLPRNVALYVIQIRGDFDCPACKGIWAKPPHGSVMILTNPLQDDPQIGYGFDLGNIAYDLSKLGTVHSFQLS